MILTRGGASLCLGSGEGGKEQGRQNRDDSDDDKEFDEGERGPGGTDREPTVWECLTGWQESPG